MKKALIIGGGFAGCTMAHQLDLQGGWDTTIVEAAPYLGAGVRTQWYGGHPYTFGPRHFLTKDPHLFEFLNKYIPLRRCEELTYQSFVEADQQFYNYPMHRDDVSVMPDREKILHEVELADNSAVGKNFEEHWIAKIGPTLYNKFMRKYTQKMWCVNSNTEIDDPYLLRVGNKEGGLKSGPKAAFLDFYSAYPFAANGYDDYFEISTQNSRILLSTKIENFDIDDKSVVINGERYTYDIIINTISPDILYNYKYGELQYVGIDLQLIVLPVESCFPETVAFLYYPNDEPYKRIVEYKRFTHHVAPTTLLGLEIVNKNRRHYPLPIKSEQEKAKKYLNEMPEGVFSIGRAGSYSYEVDIDDCIKQAMEVAEKLK